MATRNGIQIQESLNNSDFSKPYPKYLLAKILYYLLYNANILNTYQLYYKTLCLVSKYWFQLINDIQDNNIYEIRYAGSRKPIESLEEFKSLSKLVNKKALNLSLSQTLSELYLLDKSLDNYITLIDMNKQRETMKLRSSPSLKSFVFILDIGNSLRLNMLSDELFINLEELSLKFYTRGEPPYYCADTGLLIDLKEWLENSGKNTMKSLCNLKSLVIHGNISCDYEEIYCRVEVNLQNLGKTILENNILNLRVFKLKECHLSYDSLIIIIEVCLVLEELTLKNLYLSSELTDFQSTQLLEEAIGNSESLKIVYISRAIRNLSLNSLINCLNKNKSIVDLTMRAPFIIDDSVADNGITNNTLKFILLKEKTPGKIGYEFPIIKYWKFSSKLESINIYSQELTDDLSSVIHQYHSSSTQIRYFLDKVNKDSLNVNLFDIKFPNLKHLVLAKEKLQKQDIFRYITLNINTITSLCIDSIIKFKSMCTIISTLKSITSLEFLKVKADAWNTLLYVNSLLSNQSLLSIKVLFNSCKPIEYYLESLILILNNNPNLQDIEILYTWEPIKSKEFYWYRKHLSRTFKFHKESLKTFKETLMKRSLNIRSIITEFIEISEILNEFLILNKKKIT